MIFHRSTGDSFAIKRPSQEEFTTVLHYHAVIFVNRISVLAKVVFAQNRDQNPLIIGGHFKSYEDFLFYAPKFCGFTERFTVKCFHSYDHLYTQMSTWVDPISLGDGIGELGQFISVEGSHFRLSYYEALTSSSKCNFRLQGASLV